MPLFEEKTNQTNQGANQDSTQSQPQPNPENKSGLLTMISQLLPLAPFAFEQFTGQKVPHMSGTMAEVVNSLQQIQISLSTLANNQQQLAQRLIALETNANNHLTNLTNQFKSLRLTHTKEQKQIEFDRPQPETENY